MLSEAGIWDRRLRPGIEGCDLGSEAGIWDRRLGSQMAGWDLGLEAGISDRRLTSGIRGRDLGVGGRDPGSEAGIRDRTSGRRLGDGWEARGGGGSPGALFAKNRTFTHFLVISLIILGEPQK